MTKEQLIKDMAEASEAFYKHGGKIEINWGLPYIRILQTDGEEWFFQEHEAQQLIDEIDGDFIPEHYFIWTSREW